MTIPDDPWGPYPCYQDIARLEYGRRFWKHPEYRSRLLERWTHPDHPYRERFLRQRELLEWLLESSLTDMELDRVLRGRGTSLRALTREIPPAMAVGR